jgi:biotin synthase-related radical SAM superfamily protein
VKEEKKLYSLDPAVFVYTALKSFNETMEMYQKGELQQIDSEAMQEDIENAVENLVSNLVGQYTTFEDFVNLFPKKYRPGIRALKNRPADLAIDIVCDIAKEYLKEYVREEDGSYPSLEKVVTKVMVGRFYRKVKSIFKRG